MTSINKQSPLWSYLSVTQRDLIEEGDYLVRIILEQRQHNFKDYSFLVFPYAKAYEGFLKQLFLDLHFLTHLDYISDHFRLGKFLSPNLMDRLGDRSLFRKVQNLAGNELAEKMWQTWKMGRNQIFHYYPHNIKALSYNSAELTIADIIETMIESYKLLRLQETRHQNESSRVQPLTIDDPFLER